MAVTLYPVLPTLRHDDAFDLDTVIAASAEGYAFPTTLDRPEMTLQQALDEHAARRHPDDS